MVTGADVEGEEGAGSFPSHGAASAWEAPVDTGEATGVPEDASTEGAAPSAAARGEAEAGAALGALSGAPPGVPEDASGSEAEAGAAAAAASAAAAAATAAFLLVMASSCCCLRLVLNTGPAPWATSEGFISPSSVLPELPPLLVVAPLPPPLPLP